MGMEFAPT